jgi:hypothetical protein
MSVRSTRPQSSATCRDFDFAAALRRSVDGEHHLGGPVASIPSPRRATPGLYRRTTLRRAQEISSSVSHSDTAGVLDALWRTQLFGAASKGYVPARATAKRPAEPPTGSVMIHSTLSPRGRPASARPADRQVRTDVAVNSLRASHEGVAAPAAPEAAPQSPLVPQPPPARPRPHSAATIHHRTVELYPEAGVIASGSAPPRVESPRCRPHTAGYNRLVPSPENRLAQSQTPAAIPAFFPSSMLRRDGTRSSETDRVLTEFNASAPQRQYASAAKDSVGGGTTQRRQCVRFVVPDPARLSAGLSPAASAEEAEARLRIAAAKNPFRLPTRSLPTVYRYLM